jgi:hypothetical protein
VNRKLLLGFAMLVLIACASPQRVAAQPFDAAPAPSPEQWKDQLLTAHQEVIRAHERHQDALKAYRMMRHRNRKRGEPKRLILEELELAEAAVPKAEQELVALTEAARRAGVPPGSRRFDEADLSPAAND